MSTTNTLPKKLAETDLDQVSQNFAKKKKMTVPAFAARKGQEPLVCLTAYTAHVAHLVDEQADMILVGDSLGMVIHGMPNTLGVTMEHMIMHGQAVMRGAQKALVVVDMPFGSFEESPEMAFRNASRIIKETGCTAIKLEGGTEMAGTIKYLSARGIPVMAHIGLMPQQMNTAGGFKAVREQDQFDGVIEDARAVEAAGAFAVVVEGVALGLANKITKAVAIPTIGIGASAECDGQILVFEDMVGLFPRVPTFVKRYGNMEAMMRDAIARYAAEVRDRSFPADEHTYKAKEKS
ncbi:MAG: 3-methyl-2-oxobutanoate hydroxymethyltransferase [Rhodobacteraceae bacterium]|nr:MAG: 3-methyl-2-oxobutanoate hydroxymethyltransferase [Paracoccaceae bacterium]